jgi:hypothetical protein
LQIGDPLIFIEDFLPQVLGHDARFPLRLFEGFEKPLVVLQQRPMLAFRVCEVLLFLLVPDGGVSVEMSMMQHGQRATHSANIMYCVAVISVAPCRNVACSVIVAPCEQLKCTHAQCGTLIVIRRLCGGM